MLKKILVFLICVVTLGIVVLLSFIVIGNTDKNENIRSKRVNVTTVNDNYIKDSLNEEYEVYCKESLIATFDNYEDACKLSDETPGSVVKKNGGGNIYENIYVYAVIREDVYTKYKNIYEAYSDAYTNGGIVCDTVKGKSVYEKTALSGDHKIKGVKNIGQYPELHRGCEITSLCMLFDYWGVKKTKMQLSQEIIKDNTPYKIENGVVHYGNPNVGFVGDIYSKSNKGYGVYHKPIYNLLESYFRERALDITGTAPSHLYYFLDKDCPVWVIVNVKFEPLTSDYFESWYTSEGEIQITYSEHSVLLTGYDGEYVYFNDPMKPDGMKKAKRSDFEAAWEQMGSQAVTVVS